MAAFVKGLEKDVPKLDDRLEMWRVLRKRDALAAVSEGGGSLYYTPNDVDLSIETRSDNRNGKVAHGPPRSLPGQPLELELSSVR